MNITNVIYAGLEYPLVTVPFTFIKGPTREIWSLKIDDIQYVYFIYFVYHETILTTLKNYNIWGCGDILHQTELPLDINNPEKTLNKFKQLLLLQ